MYEKSMGQAAQGSSYSGQVTTYQDTKPAQPTRLDTAADHLGKMQAGFSDINARIARLADRLAGSIPEPVEKNGAISGGPSCTAHRLELTIEDFGATLRRMDSIVSRLEAL